MIMRPDGKSMFSLVYGSCPSLVRYGIVYYNLLVRLHKT